MAYPALGLLLLCCGGFTVIGALADKPQQTQRASDDRQDAIATDAPASQAPLVDATAGPPTTTPTTIAPTPTGPTVVKRTVTETAPIPFARKTVKDSSLPEGSTKLRTRGVPGVKTITYEVTLTNGVQTGKRLVSQKTTKTPVTQVTAIGTKPRSNCDPNYSGCVPVASDVDCAGGTGNGPAYVRGPITVIGNDIYGLDHDNDGTACE